MGGRKHGQRVAGPTASSNKNYFRADRMAQQVKVLVVKSNDINLISGTHMITLSSDLHMCMVVHTFTHTQINSKC